MVLLEKGNLNGVYMSMIKECENLLRAIDGNEIR